MECAFSCHLRGITSKPVDQARSPSLPKEQTLPTLQLGAGKSKRVFDARPDRIDFRDRIYEPRLVSLPPEYPNGEMIHNYFEVYSKHLILDQGNEGACTGFGLAATVNYLSFATLVQTCLKECESEEEHHGLLSKRIDELERVSPWMLYHLARIYDEWAGEDYEGSSCRGAMKGWHRHGACHEDKWSIRETKDGLKFKPPEDGWQLNAAQRPLGAYYRIDKDSIADLHSAIYEVGAIYVSATVHEGWMIGEHKQLTPLTIDPKNSGGHAFAIIGYTADGFIVQNSWGKKWGFHGFAVMTYEDWVMHATDAWVSVTGAPMRVEKPSRSFSHYSLLDVDSGKAQWFWKKHRSESATRYKNRKVEPISEAQAYEHTLVMTNEGRPLNRFIDVASAADAVKEVAFNNPKKWMASQQTGKLAIYAHGGLNDEEASLKRIRVMAPYFRENNIYPVFLTWKTGINDSLRGMLDDVVSKFFLDREAPRHRGWFADLRNQVIEARDRSIEVACRQVLIKAIWDQIKQNAAASAEEVGGGLRLLANHLFALSKEIPNFEIHFVGHSAGAIILGHLLDRLAPKDLKVKSCTLFAPACTLDFALDHYGKAHDKKVLSKSNLVVDLMSEKLEQADSIGPYGKSLLYLVSRALEVEHKTPLLGIDAAWAHNAETTDKWSDSKSSRESLIAWRKFAGTSVKKKVYSSSTVSDGREEIKLNHGSFDNDVQVITETLKRIRGGKLLNEVESLHGF